MIQEKIQYIKNWLFRANEDIAVIERLIESGPQSYTSSICFHAEQAVEKFLKAFLAYHDIDFPRTHDVDFLILECQKIDKDTFDIDLKNLTEFGVSLRYPDDFYIPDIEESIVYQKIAVKNKWYQTPG